MTLGNQLFVTKSLLAIVSNAEAQEKFNEVDYNSTRTVFNLNAPNATSASTAILSVYNDGEGGKPEKEVKMRKEGVDRWTATVKGDLNGKFYTFNTGLGETPGVFAKAVGVNGKRGAVLNMAETNPWGWENDKRPALKSPSDLVIYELHYRDFSIDPSSNLQYNGKFLALTEPRAVNYLKSLGINAVQIMPSFDFASVDESKLNEPQYNWGYDPLNYNVPEGSYSRDPYSPKTRILEFKQMVQSLHRAGIRVILDVVYNHTFDIKSSNFQLTSPGSFYRFDADSGLGNGSGCGNETASEKPLMHEFMLESVKYWVNEYHIDGFRFDLMGVHDYETMNDIRTAVHQIDPSIFIYGEGWSAGKCALSDDKLATKANIRKMPEIGAFSDDIRDALRGPFNDDTKGAFLAGVPGEEESLKAGIAGMIFHPQVDYGKVNYSKEPWTYEPTQMISYVSCHDDMCLADRLKSEIPGIDKESLIRLDELAQTAIFTSQGVPFMLCGEEMLRTKQGVHNSYKSPDAVNHLDWENLKRYPQLLSYYKNLIHLRLNHPAFRLGKSDLVRKHLEFFPSQDCFVGFKLIDNAGGDTWKTIYVYLNGNKTAKNITLPTGNYTVVCNGGQIDENGLVTFKGGNVSVGAQSALILHD